MKLPIGLVDEMRRDLSRPHPFAHERVGFLSCRFVISPGAVIYILAHRYRPVATEDYIADSRFGALIGSPAFRKAMQLALTENVGQFHVHLHPHSGRPSPSRIDVKETARFVPDFFHVRPKLPHGALILSNDSASARVWLPGMSAARRVTRFHLIGAPMTWIDA